MTDYYISASGSGTSPYDTWAKAAVSADAFFAAITPTNGDRIFIDSTTNNPYPATLTFLTGPSSWGLPCTIISATYGSSPPTYAAATALAQLRGSLDGSFSLWGVGIRVIGIINLNNDNNEHMNLYDCELRPNQTGYIQSQTSSGKTVLKGCTINLTDDATTERTAAVLTWGLGQNLFVRDLNFVNPGYRSGYIFDHTTYQYTGVARISSCDFSGFTHANLCEWANANGNCVIDFTDCKSAATWKPFFDTTVQGGFIGTVTNCGSGDERVSLYQTRTEGALVASSSIYRTGGASIEATNTAWLITTSAYCSIDTPYVTQWIYGVVSSTGSKTFDVYITNDTADLYDDEAWLEIEYKADTTSSKWTLVDDKIATRLTTPVAQTDDTDSTWNGSGPSFTYKQKLSITATVNTTGQFRARVCFGKASIAASSYLYVDPKVIVS